jgi:transposase
MFRLFTSQMIDSGACRLVDIVKTFGVSKSSVIRSLKKLRSEGSQGFFKARRGRRSASIMTAEVLQNAQRLLQQGYGKRETAEELGVAYDTFRKAIQDGRLHEPKRRE